MDKKVNDLLTIIFNYRINNEIEGSSFKLVGTCNDSDDEDCAISHTPPIYQIDNKSKSQFTVNDDMTRVPILG